MLIVFIRLNKKATINDIFLAYSSGVINTDRFDKAETLVETEKILQLIKKASAIAEDIKEIRTASANNKNEYTICRNKFGRKRMTIYSLILSIVSAPMLCTISVFTEKKLYFLSPVVALCTALVLKIWYSLAVMPVLRKTYKQKESELKEKEKGKIDILYGIRMKIHASAIKLTDCDIDEIPLEFYDSYALKYIYEGIRNDTFSEFNHGLESFRNLRDMYSKSDDSEDMEKLKQIEESYWIAESLALMFSSI